MDLDKLFGLPAHPLLVHIPVVLIPLAAVGAVAIVVSKKLRLSLGWIVAGFAVVGGFGALLAASAGESLQWRLLNQGKPVTQALRDHTELGDAAQGFAVAFAGAIVAYVVLDIWLRRRAAKSAPALTTTDETPSAIPSGAVVALKKYGLPVLAVATVVTGALSTAVIVKAGHTGAKASWENVVQGG